MRRGAVCESTELEDIETKVSNTRTSILSGKSEPVTNIGELTEQWRRDGDAGHKYPSTDCNGPTQEHTWLHIQTMTGSSL